MAKTELKDDVFQFESTGTRAIPVTSEYMLTIVRMLGNLTSVLPMTSYDVVRVGVTDVWNVRAMSLDGREYLSTVSIEGSVPHFTLTSFPRGTAVEVELFVLLLRAISSVLKVYDISTIEVSWES